LFFYLLSDSCNQIGIAGPPGKEFAIYDVTAERIHQPTNPGANIKFHRFGNEPGFASKFKTNKDKFAPG
jgi:hypothetical protein